MKDDLINLSGVVQDMTKLNKDLNAKITAMNDEIETANADAFTSKTKAEHAEGLEKNLYEQVEENKNLMLQTKKQA